MFWLGLIVGLFLLYVVMGIIGFLVHGLFFLFIIAAVLFVLHLIWASFRRGRARARRDRV